MHADDEDKQLRMVALQNMQGILQARQRAEAELLKTKEALEDETRVLELLNSTGALLASNLDMKRVVQAVIDAATQLSGAQVGAFFLRPRGAEVLELSALSGGPRETFDRFAPTLTGERVIRIADVRADPRRIPLPICSYLQVPVIARTGKIIGGLFFGHAQPGIFTARAERLTTAIAAQAAIAIDNARLYEQAKRSADERAQMLEAERAARTELERVNVMKDEFLATLSHELRTPLNAVLGWSEVLLSRATDARTRKGLETIVRNARAQAQLIEDLLDMNRIMSGKLRLDVQLMDLKAVVEAALEAVQPSVDAKGITLQRTIDPTVTPIFGDPNRLQQVIWNLLTNAVKFTPINGKIEVTVQRVGASVEVLVRDTGVGISAEFLPQVFERFRQADSSTTRRFGGLGLGLSIVKQLVELHGGTISAQSPGDGAGASFIVSLPLRASSDEAATRKDPLGSSAPHGDSLAGVKVLVIDDEPDARELATFVLSAAGAEVISAGSATEGLAMLKAQLPDVVVSDLGMPERDGYQFIRDVRALADSEGGTTPAVALTAYARSEDRARSMLAGYQVHAAKPIRPAELVATIKSLAGNNR